MTPEAFVADLDRTNSEALDRLAVSENLREQIEALPHVVVEKSIDATWDNDGNLRSPF